MLYLPLAIAAVYVKIFIDDPGLRGGHTARLYWPPLAFGFAEPTIETIAPEVGSRATNAPWLTFRYASLAMLPLTESWASPCSLTLSVLTTRSPPVYVMSFPNWLTS